MFKTMTGCLDPKKSPKPEDLKKISSFVFCRWLSGSPFSVIAANQINYYYDIPIENQYNMIKNAFAGKIKYIPYPKNETEDKQKHVQYLIEYFKISEEKARDYLRYISKEELQYITKLYETQTGRSK